MSNKIKISWEAQDGYVGGSRPQSLKIDPADFFGLSESELEAAITEAIQEDFESKVSWHCDVEEAKEQIRQAEIEATAREEDQP